MAIGAVVAEEYDDRVIAIAALGQGVEQSTRVPIKILHHRERRPRMRNVLGRRLRAAQRELLIGMRAPPPVGNLHRRMGRVVRDHDEERFGA